MNENLSTQLAATAPPDTAAPAALPDAALRHDKLLIGGIRCSACSQLIEFRLRQLAGVSAFQINAATHHAEIRWNPKKINLNRIIGSVADLGYSALPGGADAAVLGRESKAGLWRLFVAGFAMMQVMMYAFPAYLVPNPQMDGDLTPDIDFLLKLASLAITLPVLVFSALPFFQAAVRDLRNRHVGMDVPVSVGILFTFIASLWATFMGGPVYYDSLIMFVFLLLSARMIEAKVHRKSTSALRALTQLAPVYAERLLAYPDTRRSERVTAAQLNVGDHLLILPGTQIPADGLVVEGDSDCDESLMTGESHPVSKAVGAELIGGAMNLSGPLVMAATRVGDETQLSSLVRMMESAASEKPPLVQLADRHASRFLTAILLLAMVTGLVWWQIDPARALWIAVTVIVVTCPCALSLATPGVMSGAIGQLAKHGVLVARGRAIETLARATHFVFDKTGTLTQGQLRLVATQFLRNDPALDAFAIRSLAAELAGASMHPVSRALAWSGAAPQQFSGQYEVVREVAGQGVEATHQGLRYRLGNVRFVQDLHGQPLTIPPDYAGSTLAALGDANGWIALFGLEDALRDDAKALINFLREQGKEIILLSGDRQDVVARVAHELGIAAAYGDLSPGQKHDAVKKMQGQGAVVAMVGDGMNDGPVLSLADVSVAMGQGAPISQARSDIVLISNHLLDVSHAVRITSKSLALIRQNLAWAVLYNLVAIPAAAFGVLAPWHAAVGMALSSLVVVLNSLRISASSGYDTGSAEIDLSGPVVPQPV